MSQASNLIAQLQAQGYSKAQIARAISRDASIISQIEKGKKSGASYVPALQDLLAGSQQVNIPRRTKKSGTEANVRVGAIKDEEGRIINTDSKTVDGVQMQRTLKNIEKKGGMVGVVVTFKYYQAYDMNAPTQMDIPLWSNGVSAKWINQKLASGYTFSELLTEQVRKAYDPTVASTVLAVQINAVYK